MDQIWKKVLLVFPQLGVQTHNSSTLPISFEFHQGVNLDSFVFEAECLLPNIIKFDLYIGIRILTNQ